MGRLALSRGKGPPVTGATLALTGFAATASKGSLSAVVAANSIALTGKQATASKGSLSISGAIPASVNAPVSGTDLTAVWNLQFSGTGPRTSFTNGTWSGSLDAYLTSKGFVIGNDNGCLNVNCGSSTVTVDNYNFLQSPRIQAYGTGKIIFTDCGFNDVDSALNGGFSSPRDPNGSPTGQNFQAEFWYCNWNIGGSYCDTGSHKHYFNRWSNQVQQIWGSTNGSVLIEDSYCTGGGCNPPAGSHVELIQFNSLTPQTFTTRRCIYNFIDGQASLGVPGGGNYGWTGVFTTPGTGDVLLEDCIIIGLTEIDSNPANPARMGCTVQYGTNPPGTVTLTNCVLQQATFGYTLNGTAAPGNTYRPAVSNNRTYANVALTTPDFG